MEMRVALLILKTGERIVALTEQLEYEPRVHMQHPYVVSGKTKVVLTPWPGFTDENDFLIHSTDLLTATEPTDKIKEQYADKIGKTLEDLKTPPPPVMLTEEGDPNDLIEPDYVELPDELH